MKKFSLSKQLITITIVVFGFLFIILGFYIPNLLSPVYENNLYYILEKPLTSIRSVEEITTGTDIAFIVDSDQVIMSTENLGKIISLNASEIVKRATKDRGKFTYNKKTYYYVKVTSKYSTKISITDNSYIESLKKNISKTILPILILTFIIVISVFIIWIRKIINNIDFLNTKIRNIDNDNFNLNYKSKVNDELKLLSDSISEVKLALKEQNEYKNQMYQSISHDLKTPIAVIKSYIEGVEDEIIPTEEGLRVIGEEILKLDKKVKSLLYLNKLNYLEETKTYTTEQIDIEPILNESIKNLKLQNKNIKFELEVIGDNKFFGTIDIWTSIIDNILTNFIRYAETVITIKVKNNKITMYNDGENIDLNLLKDIFSPYKKGLRGEFGLGLSIVKKSVQLLGYDITIRNEKKGVSFIIKPLSKK